MKNRESLSTGRKLRSKEVPGHPRPAQVPPSRKRFRGLTTSTVRNENRAYSSRGAGDAATVHAAWMAISTINDDCNDYVRGRVDEALLQIHFVVR